MSKLYEKYLLLKNEDPTKIYLFKTGIFYLILDDDARKVASCLSLKLTNLNSSIIKCGFPVNSLTHYLAKFQSFGLDVSIVDCIEAKASSPQSYILNSNIKNFITDLSKLNSEELSIKEAYQMLDKIQLKAKELIE